MLFRSGVVNWQSGELNWPGLWAEPRQNIDLFQSDFSVVLGDEGTRVEVKSAQLRSQQARVDFRLVWNNTQTAPLGHLDLQADMAFAPVGQVLRWLPTPLPESVRQYLKLALPQGEVRQTHARVLGRLDDFPFKIGRAHV